MKKDPDMCVRVCDKVIKVSVSVSFSVSISLFCNMGYLSEARFKEVRKSIVQ